MKKLIWVLVVIVLLLVAAIAGIMGYVWYRDSHIFVDDAVYALDSTSLDLRGQDISPEHYETVREQLPNCQILWDAPFQNGKYSNDTTAFTITSLTDADMAQLVYFPELKSVDAMGCRDYAQLEKLMAAYPDLDVRYEVTLGSKSFGPDTDSLELHNGDYEFETLLENLIYLPDVTAITLRMPELTQEQISQLEEAYPGISVACTVELLGQEYAVETSELDLSSVTPEQVAQVVDKLSWLPNVTAVQLMAADGTSLLGKADVKLLMDALPGAVFNYSFDFYDYTLSTADEEVHIKNKKIGDAGMDEVRAALDIMTNCKRFVLEYCQISNENMAQLREEYRGRTKVVWRVFYGIGSTMTDAEIIRAVYDLVDDNCYNLIYCEDARFMDIGHNEWLDQCDFVSGMTSLEYVIISGAPVKSLEPFRNCKNLKVLEAAFCEYIESVEPLRECTQLERLNISYTHVTDLSPLDDLEHLVNVCAMYYPRSRVPQEEQDRFRAVKPDIMLNFVGSQPYGSVWRYDKNNDPLPWYSLIREVFRYDIYPDTPNHVGWYLGDKALEMIAQIEAEKEPADPPAEQTVPEETVAEPTEITT